MSALYVSSFAALTKEEIYSVYDYNNDGAINLEDARTVLRVSSKIEAPAEGKDYDVDKSGSPEPDYNDVKAALYIALGISTENIVVDDSAYMLELFRNELNSIKTVKPGFTKNSTTHCSSILVTTRNVPTEFSSLNVKDMDFREYIDLLDETMKPYYLLAPSLKTEIQTMKTDAAELYKPQVAKPETVNKGVPAHITKFPITNLGYSCYLELDDIESIQVVDEGDCVVRTVTMGEVTYVGNDYPTGSAGFQDRYKKVTYGKVFNIPALSETDGSVVNSVTFKDGVIKVTVDKLTGVPVKVEYSYTYIADVQAPANVNEDGSEGIGITRKTTISTNEVYTINPAEVN